MGVLYLALLGLFFFLIGLPALKSANPVLIAIWLLVTSVLVFAWSGVHYLIENDHLVVKIGPFTERSIPVDEITTVHRSFELQSSSAGPSPKKLKVRFKGGEALISPAREQEFLEALKAANPKIFVDLTMVTTV